MENAELIFMLVALAITLAGGALIFWLIQEAPLPPFAEEQTIQIDGFKIHYSVQGQGAPVLMIHGLAASLHSWTELAPLMAQEFQTIALDLPGFGGSSKLTARKYGLDEQAGRIESFLDALHIDRCAVIGNSMGGNLALWLASRNPKRFPRIAVIAPAFHPKLAPRAAIHRGSCPSVRPDQFC